jgi:hypothetical protein
MLVLNIKEKLNDEVYDLIYKRLNPANGFMDYILVSNTLDMIKNVDLISVDASCFNNFDFTDCYREDDLALDLLEANVLLVIKNIEDINPKIKNVFDGYGLQYYNSIDELFKVDLINPNKFTYGVINELFEANVKLDAYFASEALVNIDVDNTFGLEQVIDALNNTKLSYDYEKISNSDEEIFNYFIYDKLFLLVDSSNLYDAVIEYKYKVFDQLQNITVEEMTQLPTQLLNLLGEHNFIPKMYMQQAINNGWEDVCNA